MMKFKDKVMELYSSKYVIKDAQEIDVKIDFFVAEEAHYECYACRGFAIKDEKILLYCYDTEIADDKDEYHIDTKYDNGTHFYKITGYYIYFEFENLLDFKQRFTFELLESEGAWVVEFDESLKDPALTALAEIQRGSRHEKVI